MNITWTWTKDRISCCRNVSQSRKNHTKTLADSRAYGVPNVVGTRHLMEWTSAGAPQSQTNIALLANLVQFIVARYRWVDGGSINTFLGESHERINFLRHEIIDFVIILLLLAANATTTCIDNLIPLFILIFSTGHFANVIYAVLASSLWRPSFHIVICRMKFRSLFVVRRVKSQLHSRPNNRIMGFMFVYSLALNPMVRCRRLSFI